jgi:deoxyadenosine/deoxycytidine kinase
MAKVYSVEGNIGSGKSTLIKMLKAMCSDPSSNLYDKVVFVQEPVDIWMSIQSKDGETILSKFYKDNKKYAFSFQMMAYISRVSILKNAILSNPDKIIICERSIYTDKNVFAKMLYENGDIEDVNYQIYLKWFEEFSTIDIQNTNDTNHICDNDDDDKQDNDNGIKPESKSKTSISGLIYVKAEPEVSYQRVLKRQREGENIPLEYLKNCHNYHENWLNEEKDIQILTLQANDNKEENNRSYYKWLREICKFIGIESNMDDDEIETDDDNPEETIINNFQKWDTEMLFIC